MCVCVCVCVCVCDEDHVRRMDRSGNAGVDIMCGRWTDRHSENTVKLDRIQRGNAAEREKGLLETEGRTEFVTDGQTQTGQKQYSFRSIRSSSGCQEECVCVCVG